MKLHPLGWIYLLVSPYARGQTGAIRSDDGREIVKGSYRLVAFVGFEVGNFDLDELAHCKRCEKPGRLEIRETGRGQRRLRLLCDFVTRVVSTFQLRVG